MRNWEFVWYGDKLGISHFKVHVSHELKVTRSTYVTESDQDKDQNFYKMIKSETALFSFVSNFAFTLFFNQKMDCKWWHQFISSLIPVDEMILGKLVFIKTNTAPILLSLLTPFKFSWELQQNKHE